MQESQRVVVYGSSLHMAGIAANLQVESGVQVVSLDPCFPTVGQSLLELNPTAIVFDLTETVPGKDVALLRKRTGLLLIGVDPSGDEVLVLSSRPTQALSVADLVRVIVHRNRNTKTTRQTNRSHRN